MDETEGGANGVADRGMKGVGCVGGGGGIEPIIGGGGTIPEVGAGWPGKRENGFCSPIAFATFEAVWAKGEATIGVVGAGVEAIVFR